MRRPSQYDHNIVPGFHGHFAYLIALVVIITALTGCSGPPQEQAPPEVVSPEQLLQRTNDRMSSVTTYHFTMTLDMKITSPENKGFAMTLPMTGEGDMILPNKSRMTLEMQAPVATKVEIISLPDRVYTKDAKTNQWRSSPRASQSSDLTEGMTDPSQYLSYLKAGTRIEDRGKEMQGGLELRKIAFVLDPDKLNSMKTESLRAMEFSDTGVEVWFNENEGYLNRMKMNMSMTGPMPGTANATTRVVIAMDLDMRLSNFNAPLEIQAPAVTG